MKKGPTEDLKGEEEYYSFHLPGEHKRVKGLTAVILKDSPDDKDLPMMERTEGKDWIGLKVRRNGKVTDIYINQLADGRLMHNNSWITVPYDEGTDPAKASEMFVCYGSALRRGEVSYYSSLSKLFVMQRREGKKLDLRVEGQPHIRAAFRQPSCPAELEVNGQRQKAVYENGNVILKSKL